LNTLAMFPGQGSQYVGMGSVLLEQFPYVAKTFEEAEDASKVNIRKLCSDGPEAELRLTANTQPCILTVSVATWDVLKEETGFDPEFFAGHSLGEYSALVAGGVLSIGEAAMLVRRRGSFMQEAVPEGVGAMAAIMQTPGEELEKLCRELSEECGKCVEVANYNNPQQLVVAGHKEAVGRLVESLTAQNKRCVNLPVSAPFHSSLMAPAREQMVPLLTGAGFQKTAKKIFANLTGKVEESYTADFLIEQIDSPVRWTQTIENCAKLEMQRYVEVGPGKVLWGLARKTLPRRNSAELLATDGDELISTLKVLSSKYES